MFCTAAQIGSPVWTASEVGSKIVALHLLRGSTFYSLEPHHGVECVSLVLILPGFGFFANSETCSSFVLRNCYETGILQFYLFNSLSSVFLHHHYFRYFTVSEETLLGEFANTYICSYWYLVSVQFSPFAQLPQSC